MENKRRTSERDIFEHVPGEADGNHETNDRFSHAVGGRDDSPQDNI